MLTEGKERLFTFMVRYVQGSDPFHATVRTTSAQRAVDYVSKIHPDSYIVEVWKVVDNWK